METAVGEEVPGTGTIPMEPPQESSEEIKRKVETGEYFLRAKEGARLKSSVWARFHSVHVKANGQDTGAVACTQCGFVKLYNGTSQGTSVLSRHKCQAPGPSSCPSQDAPKIEPTPAVRGKFKEACVDFCARDLRPFRAVAGPGFNDLVQSAIDIGATHGRVNAATLIPDPCTVSRGISDRADRAKLQVMPQIINAIRAGELSATADMWKEPFSQDDYITVTAHFLDEDWKLRMQVLHTMTLPFAEKSGRNIRDDLLTQLGVLGICEEDFFKIIFVTDGGSNMVSAIENRLYCMAHILNLVVEGTTSLKRRDVDLYGGKTMKQIMGDSQGKTTPEVDPPTSKQKTAVPSSKLLELEALRDRYLEQQEEGIGDEDVGDCVKSLETLLGVIKQLDKLLGKFKPADSLPGKLWQDAEEILKPQDEDSDIAKRYKEEVADDLGLLIEAVQQIDLTKALVGNAKRCSKDKLNLPSTVKTFVETRWNSLLRMLRSVDLNFDALLAYYRTSNNKERFVNGLERPKLKELITFLEVFEQETDLLQAHKVPTLHIPLLTYYRLKLHCTPIATDSLMLKKLKLRGSEFLDQKLKPWLTIRHKVATFLHPAYRKLKWLSHLERTQIHEHVKIMIDAIPDVETGSRLPSTSNLSKRHRINELDDALRDQDEEDEDEFSRYLTERKGDDKDLCKWWKDRVETFPRLSQVARQIFCTPATEAPSERVFSATGFTVNARRSTLSPESLNNVTFLHFHYSENRA